jgi:hypothetical protein
MGLTREAWIHFEWGEPDKSTSEASTRTAFQENGPALMPPPPATNVAAGTVRVGDGRDTREGRLAGAGVVSWPRTIVAEAALPPTRTLPTTSWGEGAAGAGAFYLAGGRERSERAGRGCLAMHGKVKNAPREKMRYLDPEENPDSIHE